jgi:hypothetical protein
MSSPKFLPLNSRVGRRGPRHGFAASGMSGLGVEQLVRGVLNRHQRVLIALGVGLTITLAAQLLVLR